jgi:rhodanese-related sulfurtransferase
MIKRTALTSCLLALAGCAAPGDAPASSDSSTQQVAAKETLVVLKLDPRQSKKDAAAASQSLMYGYPILDRVEVLDPAVIHDIMTRLNQGFAAEDVEPTRCFLPRHGVIHTTEDGKTEYVICFQCSWYSAVGQDASGGRATTSPAAKGALDRVLRAEHPEEATVIAIPSSVLEQWMQEGKVVLIDVREQDEHEAERIAGAHHVALSTFDPSSIKAAFKGKRIVFHCQAGGRSAIAVQKFHSADQAIAMHLEGGIEAWKASGRQTVSD